MSIEKILKRVVWMVGNWIATGCLIAGAFSPHGTFTPQEHTYLLAVCLVLLGPLVYFGPRVFNNSSRKD